MTEQSGHHTFVTVRSLEGAKKAWSSADQAFVSCRAPRGAA